VTDASTNLTPFAFWIGGEELHNNHHAFPTSARFSMRWYEFDIGWLYIRIMETLGLASVKKVAPKPKFDLEKVSCDLETLQSVIAHRYEITTGYARTLKATCRDEIRRLRDEGLAFRNQRSGRSWKSFKGWMFADRASLTPENQQHLDDALKGSRVLETVYAYKKELMAVWERSTLSKEELVLRLDDWCKRAEASGILPLQQFSRKVRAYA
jgi:stearoyl-CoA desaturase (Delta-9 desaturase)